MRVLAEGIPEQESLEDLVWFLATEIGRLLNYEDCVIYLRKGEALEQVAACGVKRTADREIAVPITLPVGEGIVGTAAMTGVSVLVPETRTDPRYIGDQFSGASELAVPLRYDGITVGVIDTESSLANAYSNEDRKLLEAIANIASGRIAWLGSERRRRAEEDRQRTERLDGLGRLGGGVAHDFNNVLALLSGNIELARESASVAELHDCLDAMERAVSKGTSITQQLQVFAVGGTPQLEFVQLEKLAHEALESMEEFPGIECTVSLGEGLPRVQGDRLQLLKMMSNLLANAAKSMSERGRVDFSIYRAFERGSEVVVRVMDHGPPIDAADAKRIFEPYYRRRDAGLGLGIAAAYWIATRNRGDLVLMVSEEGNVFEARFPSVGGDIAIPESGPLDVTMPPHRILILDDEAGIRQVLGSLLRRRGHTVEAVADGSEVLPAWRLAVQKGEPFDVVLLDLSIPDGVGGLAALEELCGVEPQVRAVVMSGYSDDPVMSDFSEYGFSARLRKPFDASQLERALETALARPAG